MFTQTEKVIATPSRDTDIKHKVCLITPCYESSREEEEGKKKRISIWPIISRYFTTSIFPHAHGTKQNFYNIILQKQKKNYVSNTIKTNIHYLTLTHNVLPTTPQTTSATEH